MVFYICRREVFCLKIKDFIAGRYVDRFQYKSFEPFSIDLPWELDCNETNMLLSEANLKVGELNAFADMVPDINLFLQMHIFKEGTKSSRIEGTQTNIDEAIQKETYIASEKKEDWQEVQNYVKALNFAIHSLDTIPISNRLLKAAHKILLDGVRGKHKQPGEFRESQNWIGGASLTDAYFIPPHQSSIYELMSDLENFVHNIEIPVPHLVKIGILHYQFEYPLKFKWKNKKKL